MIRLFKKILFIYSQNLFIIDEKNIFFSFKNSFDLGLLKLHMAYHNAICH